MIVGGGFGRRADGGGGLIGKVCGRKVDGISSSLHAVLVFFAEICCQS